MSRANKRDTAIRTALETIGAELAVIGVKMPLICLTIEHTRSRTGLDSLLIPAVSNANEVMKSTDEIRRQIRAALDWLEQ